MNDDIFIFDFKINEDVLLLEYENQKDNIKDYTDKELYKFLSLKEKNFKDNKKNWRVLKRNFDYAEKLNAFFNVNGKPRFINQKAGVELPFHIDVETKCSLNFLLKDESPSPITYESGDYFYKSALLNTTKKHGVFNKQKDRLLFKLSIFDEDFNSVKNKVKKALKIND